MLGSLRLVGLAYSPWSLKARWALRHHLIDYHFDPYLPMIGEPILRVRLKRPLGRVSVPVLLTEVGHPVEGSFAIARWAEERGHGARLFPAGRESEIATWNDHSDDLSDAGRGLVIERTLADDGALEEATPAFVPAPLRASVGRAGALFLKRKYVHASESESRERMRHVLDEARKALVGSPYLLGDTFSYADIALASALQFVRPAPEELRFAPLGVAERRAWTDVELSREFPSVLRWRDDVISKHHRAS